MTTDPCTCETTGHCAACRPKPEWHRLSDEAFLEEMSAIAQRMNPAEMRRANAALQRRFEEPLIRISPDAMRLRAILDQWDEPAADPPDPWILQYLESDDGRPGPIRLTKEGSRLYLESLDA